MSNFAECRLLGKSTAVRARDRISGAVTNFQLFLIPAKLICLRSKGFFIDLKNRVFQHDRPEACFSRSTRPGSAVSCTAETNSAGIYWPISSVNGVGAVPTTVYFCASIHLRSRFESPKGVSLPNEFNSTIDTDSPSIVAFMTRHRPASLI